MSIFWQVLIHLVNNWRERANRRPKRTQWLECKDVLVESAAFQIPVAGSSLSTSLWQEKGNARLSTTIASLHILCRRHQLCSEMHSQGRANFLSRDHYKPCETQTAVSLSKRFTNLQATIPSTSFLLISPMPSSEQLKEILSRTPFLVFLQCCQL